MLHLSRRDGTTSEPRRQIFSQGTPYIYIGSEEKGGIYAKTDGGLPRALQCHSKTLGCDVPDSADAKVEGENHPRGSSASRETSPCAVFNNWDQQKVSRNIQGIRTRKTNARRVLTTLQITARRGKIPTGKPTITLSSRFDPNSALSVQKTLRVNRTVSLETPNEETTPAVLTKNSQNHPNEATTNKIY